MLDEKFGQSDQQMLLEKAAFNCLLLTCGQPQPFLNIPHEDKAIIKAMATQHLILLITYLSFLFNAAVVISAQKAAIPAPTLSAKRSPHSPERQMKM